MLFFSLVICLVVFTFLGNIILFKNIDESKLKNTIFRRCWIFQMIFVAFLPFLLLFLNYYGIIKADSIFFSWSIFAIMLLSLPLSFFFIYSLLLILPFPKKSLFRKTTTFTGLFLTLQLFCAILYGGFIGKTKITYSKETIYTDRLPTSFEGLKIIHVSDLHLGSFYNNPEFIRSVTDSINKQNPDLIFFTGDLVNSSSSETAPFKEFLKNLSAKEGIYSVLGNHDYGFYHRWQSERERIEDVNRLMKYQKEFGWTLLNNEHRVIIRGNDSIAVIGVENWGEKHFGQQGKLHLASFNIDNSHFSLLLSHNPLHWKEEVLPLTNIDVTFSGHTHAMQTQIGSLSPASWIYPQWGGLYRENNRYLYVNKGIGYVLLPARIGAYPEITIIELRNK